MFATLKNLLNFNNGNLPDAHLFHELFQTVIDHLQNGDEINVAKPDAVDVQCHTLICGSCFNKTYLNLKHSFMKVQCKGRSIPWMKIHGEQEVALPCRGANGCGWSL